MLPPTESSTLEQNSQFASLHKHLTSKLLEPNGQTRAVASYARSKAVDTALRESKVRSMRAQLLRQSLANIALNPDNALPDEIQEVVALIAALLNDTSCDLTTDDLDLLQDDTIVFKNNLLDYIGPAISHEICNTRKILRNIATPGAENSESHKARTEISTQKPLLSQELALRISELRVKQQFDIPSAHARLNSMVNEVLAAYNSLVEATIQILERVKHGTLARATKAQAEHLSTVARGMDKKVTIMRLQTLERVYSPEVQDALMNYSQHLQDARIRLSEKERASLQQLDQYESQGEAMKEIAKRFGAILKDCENVKAEIRRLGGDP